VNSLLHQSVTKGTRATYSSGLKAYKSFIALNRMSRPHNLLPPISEALLIYFVTHCHKILKISFSTINQYLCGIRFSYLSAGSCHPLKDKYGQDYPRLHMIMRAIKCQQKTPVNKRAPITYSLLCRMCTILNNGLFGRYTDCLLHTVCVVAFFGFLRCGEFTITSKFNPSIHLCVEDVTFNDIEHIAFLHLKSSKTDPFRQGVTIRLCATGKSVCPYTALKQYCVLRSSTFPDSSVSQPLFMETTQTALTRHSFLKYLHSLLLCAGEHCNVNNYKGHSFRIEEATSAAAGNVEDHLIKTLGRWTSNCYTRYVRVHNKSIHAAQKAMTSTLL